jgi:hypothetical protein
MAIELSPAGVRVVCLRTAENPDSRTIQDVADLAARLPRSLLILSAGCGFVPKRHVALLLGQAGSE